MSTFLNTVVYAAGAHATPCPQPDRQRGGADADADEAAWCREALASLCRIDTTSGREAAILPTLEDLLHSMGARVTHQPLDDGRINLLATWGTPRVLLTTHLDTVAPFISPTATPGGLAGRGTVDAKGQIVAQLAAIRRLLVAGRFGLGWLGVVGEETDAAGAIAALDLAPRLAGLEALIGGEPTRNRLATAQMGYLHLRLVCQGTRGHGADASVPGNTGASRNALWQLVDWLVRLRSLPLSADPRFGRERWNLGQIEGGEAPNVVAGEASADVVVRTVPGSTVIEDLRRCAPASGRVDVCLDEPPTVLGTVRETWPSLEGVADGGPVAFGSDVPRLAALVPPGRAFLVGPGAIEVAHTDDEQLCWHDLEAGVDVLERLADHLLASPARTTTDGAP